MHMSELTHFSKLIMYFSTNWACFYAISIWKTLSSVAQLCPTLCDPMDYSIKLPCPSPTPGACSNSWTLWRWCYPTISSSVIPFSSCFQSFPVSRSLPRSQLFASGGQTIWVSDLASVRPMNIQDWFPLGLTDWISLKFKGLSRVFSNTTLQLSPCLLDFFSASESWCFRKHQFLSVQLSL